MYFRGFLLPHMGELGKYVYIVWQKRNVYIGVISHCVVNILRCFAMLFYS